MPTKTEVINFGEQLELFYLRQCSKREPYVILKPTPPLHTVQQIERACFKHHKPACIYSYMHVAGKYHNYKSVSNLCFR